MNISGIRPYAGFYKYQESVKAKEQPDEGEHEISSLENPGEQIHQQENTKPVLSVTSGDYAKEYRPGEIFPGKGAKSDLAALDLEKPIGEMHKKEVLRQYQFFVGEKKVQNSLEQEGMYQGVQENFTIT